MSTTEFTAAYTRKVDGLYELRYTGKDCPFLLDNRCRVVRGPVLGNAALGLSGLRT